MYSSTANIRTLMADFHIEGMMLRYSSFIPRLYNLCKSLGFESGKIMPSRAFCSDENQGYPIILITQHFGVFPFNHGQVGGIVATDRHAPHAEHGRDMVIIHASHVGYEPELGVFGVYRRAQSEDRHLTASCGKIEAVLRWYQDEYAFARDNILLERSGDDYLVTIDNQLLRDNRDEGLFLNLERLAAPVGDREFRPVHCWSTAKSLLAAPELRRFMDQAGWEAGRREPIGERLLPEYFRFKRDIQGDLEGRSHLEQNLFEPMAWIVTAPHPLLTAAQVNTQVEFDRTFRTIVREHSYQGKRVLYVSGLNIDISPDLGQRFPLTKFVPWAAFVRQADGSHTTLEQTELLARLRAQPSENSDRIDLEASIQQMEQAREIRVAAP
ncbi:MAG: hypothetical protein EA420_08065 [Candidatus Competibacteraceae bacterium]|nr:MAG: hypothetical protein EA420_08065 [Candidatus Competibacteraceae bacterium]